MGQVVNLAISEQISLDFARQMAREDDNKEALAELEPLDPPYADDADQLAVQREWLYRYGGGMRGYSFLDLMGLYLTSPEYSILDCTALVGGMTAVSLQMWPEMVKVDFLTQAPTLEVPVYFFAGRYDYNTPSGLALQYFEKLEAPHKEFFWFEESAHFMNISDPDRYQDLLINEVRRQTDVR